MQNLVIEHNLKKDSGPLRSAWELAVQRGRTLSSPAVDDSHDGSSESGGVHVETHSRAKNFWEAAAEDAATSDPSTSSIIDGSTYYVVDDQQTKDMAGAKAEPSNANEPLPSPRPSPPRSPSPRRPGSPSKKASQDIWVD